MGKKIATVLTDLFEDVEYTSPKKALEDAGHELVTIGSEAGQTVEGKNGEAKVTIDKGIDEVSPEDYDVLFIPGGYSPDKLRADDRFLEFTRGFDKEGKKIFTICHGPQLMINAGIVEGKKMTAVKQVQVDLENAGANVVDEEVAVCNTGVVSSRTPDDLPAFNKAIVDALK